MSSAQLLIDDELLARTVAASPARPATPVLASATPAATPVAADMLPAATAPVASAPAVVPKTAGGLQPGRLALRAASLIAFVLAWQLASHYRADFGLITFRNVPAPSEVLPTLWQLLQSPKVGHHVGNSLYRVFGGFAAATAIGILLGLVIGRSKRAADVLLPPLEVLRPIPGVAWIPLAILMFPSSELSMIFITFMGALFPILLNTIHGVESIDPRLTATARSLGAGRLRLFSEVILPGAAPSIVTGLSIGMGTSWFCLVTAEMIAGQYGIGYYTWESYNLQRYADIVVGMLLIGVFGMGSSVLVRKLGTLLTPWYQVKGARHD